MLGIFGLVIILIVFIFVFFLACIMDGVIMAIAGPTMAAALIIVLIIVMILVFVMGGCQSGRSLLAGYKFASSLLCLFVISFCFIMIAAFVYIAYQYMKAIVKNITC
ncbi:Hypothetical protein POVR1_LOCUS316 [uncultured virus]|nr:Hypothetical protein POVR1_LOCUS316 [uncultured virus]